ncbi:DnaJ domain-containing protein [Ralstonia sp. 25mfcol4.1]|uniref:J domain-containing protein n=1 Tax=Ralstonia sp. 25mfcol4.1 TaxID=1761899 RepID=UPI00088F6A08|nr:J domain-containing protein [Ralstonia sp. 25mfcol4.1]SDO91932.1 DnaJ domain-containing protein [Ralstonia sp. 25mfcol4.1]
MHTHYDNLKVSRDAPTEVIRAAYKSLSQKYHPDRHADSEEANRIMRLLNAAYEVLRDPERRAEHDQWIIAEEKREAERTQRQAQAQRAAAAQAQRQAAQRQQAARQAASRPGQQARAADPEPTDAPPFRSRKARPDRQERTRRAARERASDGPAVPLPKYGSVALYAAIGAIIVIMLGDWSGTGEATAGSPDARAVPASAAQALARSVSPGVQLVARDRGYTRPAMTPRGMPWPDHSGYLPGYPVLNGNGLSTLTVDNSGSASDVLLKLVAVDGNAPLPVRTSFVRGGSSFTMENISPGAYDLRYQSLDSGEIFRSERFDLSEIREAAGTSANRNVFKLYAVPGGTSRSVTISEREFP